MNRSINNRAVLKWLLVISLSLNLGIAISVVVSQIKTAPPTSKLAANPVDLPDYLQLNTTQRQTWQQTETAFLQDLTSNWQQIRSERDALVREIFSESPQRAVIDARQAQIARLQDSQQRRVIAQLMTEHALLDRQQQQKLMNLLLTRYAQEAGQEEQLHRH